MFSSTKSTISKSTKVTKTTTKSSAHSQSSTNSQSSSNSQSLVNSQSLENSQSSANSQLSANSQFSVNSQGLQLAKMAATPAPTIPDLATCLGRLTKYTKDDKPKMIDTFKKNVDSCSKTAETMVKDLIEKMNCPSEIAIELSLLTLYDLVVLIDDSTSMRIEKNAAGTEPRYTTLKKVLHEIISVYSLANTNGIKSVRFLNHRQGKGNVKEADIDTVVNRSSYTGLTMMGTELHKKVLSPFVLNEKPMDKPLLVVIITDGRVEGERDGLLEKVILDCIAELTPRADRGKDAVTFQFARIGNDPKAIEFLKALDDHKKVGDLIDCLSEEMPLDLMEDTTKWEEEKWRMLPKLLLGAILPSMDESDKMLATSGKGDDVEENVPEDDVLADD